MHPQRRQAFRCLFFALAVIAFATSCGHDAGGAAPAVGQFVATVNPVTTAPTPTYDPATARETLVLPRHDEPLLVNRGDRYVYGELSLSGDCLRISYVDPSEDPWTQDGLLLVWPAGFDVRTEDDVVEVTGADGGVVAAMGQTLRVSGKHVSDRYVVVDEWDWDGGETGHCAGPHWLVGDEVTAKDAECVGRRVGRWDLLPAVEPPTRAHRVPVGGCSRTAGTARALPFAGDPPSPRSLPRGLASGVSTSIG